MHSRRAKLSQPLNIDVAKIASYFPEFRYRAPFEDVTSEYIINDANMDKFQALLFDKKTSIGFTTITSDYSPEELAVLFIRLPAELAQPLITALKGTSLEIPTLSPAMLARYQKQREEEQKEEAAFKKLQKPLAHTRQVDFKPHQAVTVLQHEYALTTADSDHPVLGTFGAGPCLILALYDESSKTAILTHIDALTNIHSLNRLFNQLSKEHTVAHLVGGDHSSKNMCLSVVEMLQKNNIKIVNADIVHSGLGDAASLAIDARTGAIYSPVMYHQLEQTADINLRLQIAGLQFLSSPINECYNSLKSSSKQKHSNGKTLETEPAMPLVKKSKSSMLARLDNAGMYPSFGDTLPSAYASLTLLSPGAKKAKKAKNENKKLIETKLNTIFGQEFSVVHILDEHIVSISPEPTYETVKQFAEKLKSAGLSVKAESPVIFDNGFVAVPPTLIFNDSRSDILEKLNLIIVQGTSLQQASNKKL